MSGKGRIGAHRFGLALVAALAAALGAWAQAPTPYEADMVAFFETIDNEYPFLDLKNIRGDWEAAKPALLERAKACASDEAFLGVVRDAMKRLRDSHLSMHETRVPPPPFRQEFYPGIGFMPASEQRVIVMAGPAEGPLAVLKTGTVIARIDGQPAREFLEAAAKKAWEDGDYHSSPQRARVFAYRIPLRGEKGAKHTIAYVDGDAEKELALTCDTEARGWPHVYNMPEGRVRESGDVSHAALPSGVGYVYLRRVRGEETTQGLEAAFKAHPDARGWIVDLRGNGGGGYDNRLKEVIAGTPRPVAVIVDAGCISAGETLARDFQRLAEAWIFGERTAGASSSKRQWRFPSGVATLTIPTRSHTQNDGGPIEFYGIVPDVPMEPVPGEVLDGKNSEILRAEAWLLEQMPAPAQPAEAPAAAKPEPEPAKGKSAAGIEALPPMSHP